MKALRPVVLLLLCALFGVFQNPVEGSAEPSMNNEPGPASLEQIIGESLDFDIGFLFLDHVAEGRLSFLPEDRPGIFRAVLEARARGVAAWLSGNRVQRFESTMEIDPAGRLRSLRFESHILKGRGAKRVDLAKTYVFDHQQGRVACEIFRDESLLQRNEISVEVETLPADILTIFYNLRAGFYGPVEPGRRFTIPTISETGESTVEVRILPPDTRKDNPVPERGGLLSEVKVARESFDTGGGLIYVWFDRLNRPRWGMVEDAFGYGDLRGIARP